MQCVLSGLCVSHLEVIALLQGMRSLQGLQVVSAPFSQPVTARCSLHTKKREGSVRSTRGGDGAVLLGVGMMERRVGSGESMKAAE